MKKIYTIIFLTFFTNQISAQCGFADTLTMGPGYANDVFYNFQNKTVKAVTNTNWHLAFSVQKSQFPSNPLSGVSIRVNSVTGSNLVKLNPAQTVSNWRKIDTTGMYALPVQYDGFKSWDSSAFTKGYNIAVAPFDFKWGTYNSSNNNLTGSRVFVLYNKTANWYKKVFISSLVYDTMWNITMSNIDNTDSVSFQINKKAYPNKLFAYRNVLAATTADREPLNNDWDVVLTRYRDLITQGPVTQYQNLTGFLNNRSVTVARNTGKKCNEVMVYNKTAPYNTNISNIGWDWKSFNGSSYDIPDTLVYFLVSKNAKIYKFSFVSFLGGSNGKTILRKDEASSILKNSFNNSILIYPNPSNGKINFDTERKIIGVLVTDTKGVQINFNSMDNQIDLSEYADGIYHIQITTADGVYHQSIIKQ